jgi:NAD(P)-dependent dehydrogenase (short-subunit alcohol dehydrogenase family)
MGRHEGKVALCVGSARGIGALAAARLAAGGAKVVIGDISVGEAEETVARIRAAGGEAVAQACDISQEADVAALVETAVSRFGGIDLVHANAADVKTGEKDGDLLNADLALFDRTIAVNLRGHLIVTRATVPRLVERGGGAIVYTSSDAAYTTGPHLYFYRISKGGLNTLMRQVAAGWGKAGIRANIVSPGMVIPDEGDYLMNAEAQANHLAKTPHTRLGKADDVAAMVEFLLSDDAAWVNGQVVSVNGGYLMKP